MQADYVGKYDENAEKDPLCDGCDLPLEEYSFDGLCPDCVVDGMNLNAPCGFELVHMGENRFELCRK